MHCCFGNPAMNVMGAGQLSVAVKRNGEVYDLLSELLGECSGR